jgi:hypothetical protein
MHVIIHVFEIEEVIWYSAGMDSKASGFDADHCQ